jgi:Patatin-like phospholipase
VDTILIFQGGGSLGAYECGVYQALAPWLRANGHRLYVVAGTSIGAINASVIAARFRDADQGAEALRNFWKSLSVKSFYFPILAGENSRWNAVWTSLLFGNPRLFRPKVPFWTFTPPVTWSPFTSFYDVHPMEETLASFFRRIGPRHENPRLIVTAVDLQKIQAVTFDSYDIAVTPRHVVASSSLPPSFPATEIDRRSYWDGGLWSNTPLAEVLRSLRKSPSSDGPQAMTDCLVFIVDLFAPGRGFPPVIHQNYDVWALRDRVLFQDKASYDERCAGWVNECIELVRGMRNRLQSLPPDRLKLVAELDGFVNESHRDLYNEKRLHLDIHRIVRSHPESDEISRDIDFSPERINSLISLGRSDTTRILAEIDRQGQDRPSPHSRPGSSSEPA